VLLNRIFLNHFDQRQRWEKAAAKAFLAFDLGQGVRNHRQGFSGAVAVS